MPADLRAKDQLTHFKVDVTGIVGYGGAGVPGGAALGAMGSDKYYGLTDSVTPPSLTVRRIEMPIAGDSIQWADGGLEPMELTFESKRYSGNLDALMLHEVQLTITGALVTGPIARSYKIIARGTVTEVRGDPWTPGETPPKALLLDLFAYRISETPNNGAEFVAIDINTRIMKREISGFDQLANLRTALGIGTSGPVG